MIVNALQQLQQQIWLLLEAPLSKGIQSGKLHVILHGKKLKGEYALVKTHGKAENAWLLFKVKDKYVSKDDITLKEKSVISKKTLAQVKATSTNIYGEKQEMSQSAPEKKETSTRLTGTPYSLVHQAWQWS